MKHMMTYHNIRNMIYQLGLSGGYCDKFNYSNLHVHEHAYDYEVEFDYSNDKDISDHVYCVMTDNKNGYEITIKIVMYRNDTRTEFNVRLYCGDDKDDVMTCDKPEEGYAVFRTRMHMIHHKATKRLIKRIYERMIVPMMNREVYEHLMEEKNAKL